MAKRKATILQDGTKDVVELKRSNPESFNERFEGHRGGGGDARAKLFGRELKCHPPQQHPRSKRRKLMFGDGGGQPRAVDVEDFGSGVYGAHPGGRPAEEKHACLVPRNR